MVNALRAFLFVFRKLFFLKIPQKRRKFTLFCFYYVSILFIKSQKQEPACHELRKKNVYTSTNQARIFR